ncbi:MAG: NACHT domain-containing protein [Chloroflexi bacterium]|nr:NACHT domain-containing protein [Chloroflexota bacterium]
MPSHQLSPKKKIAKPKRKVTRARGAPARVTRTVVSGRVACADFVGGDKRTINYGFTSQDVERLIDKVLAFLQAGAIFLPSGAQGELRAELDEETLTFQAGAALQLGQHRNERAYLLSLTVRREYQIWATKFIPLAARMDVKRSVEALDLPVAFSEFRVPREGTDAVAQITYEPLDDITDALARHAAFVILGEPGAGKTTTLQKIAFEQARHLLAGGDGRVPLLVRLSQQSNREPFEFLRAEWERRTGADFADALAAGRVLLLADGINELPRDDRDERLKAWREFTQDCAGANQIVFTGRERDYDRQLDLPRVRVEPLDDARVADYLQRNRAEGLHALLDDPKTRLREMARNPFNLSLLVAAYQSNQRDMANRGRLMEWFVGELFAREERLAHRGWLHRDTQTRALAQLAYAMQAQGESTTLKVKIARELMPTSVELNGDEVNVKPLELFRFARAATLLDSSVEPDVRFYHHLLQEYFAALELLKRFDAGEDPSTALGTSLSALWQAKRLASEMPPSDVGEWDALPEPPATGWEVTTILACGLARDPARFIETIRPHYPALAARCLDESGIEKPTAVTERVRADLVADLNNPEIHLRARLQAGYALGHIGDPRFAPQTISGAQVIAPQMVDVPAGEYVMGSAEDDELAFDIGRRIWRGAG